MPTRARIEEFLPMELLPKAQRRKEDREFQTSWYQLAGRLIAEQCPTCSVLDAGAGMGYGQKILERVGLRASSFDLVSLVPWVQRAMLDDFANTSYDYVLAMDVIEHVPDDVRFLGHLLRVARRGVFFSTPNWHVFGAKNVHHYREYTPVELVALVDMFKAHWRLVRYWAGDEHYQITPFVGALPLDTRVCNFGVFMEK